MSRLQNFLLLLVAASAHSSPLHAASSEVAFLEGAKAFSTLGDADTIAVLDADGIKILTLPSMERVKFFPNTRDRVYKELGASADGRTLVAKSNDALGIHRDEATIIRIAADSVTEIAMPGCHNQTLSKYGSRLAAVCLGNSDLSVANHTTFDLEVWNLESKSRIAQFPQATWTADDPKSGNNDGLFGARFLFTNDENRLIAQYDAQDISQGPRGEMIRTRYTILDIASAKMLKRIYHDWKYYFGDRPSTARGEVPFAVSANDNFLFVGGQQTAIFDLETSLAIKQPEGRIEGITFLGGDKPAVARLVADTPECPASHDFGISFYALTAPDNAQLFCLNHYTPTERSLPLVISANGKWIIAKYASQKESFAGIAVWATQQ